MYYQQRHDMYQIKLQQTDEFQLKNLGNYQRLYPPMQKYHQIIIPKIEENQAPKLDPLSMKLWLLD